MTPDNHPLCFVRMWSADGLFREDCVPEDYIPRDIITAIAPGVERKYELKGRAMGNLFVFPRTIGDVKLDEHSSVMILTYQEKVPTILYNKAEL